MSDSDIPLKTGNSNGEDEGRTDGETEKSEDDDRTDGETEKSEVDNSKPSSPVQRSTPPEFDLRQEIEAALTQPEYDVYEDRLVENPDSMREFSYNSQQSHGFLNFWVMDQ